MRLGKSGITHDATKIDERWKSVVQSVGLPLEVGEGSLVAKGLPTPDTRVVHLLRNFVIERQRAARVRVHQLERLSVHYNEQERNKHNRRCDAERRSPGSDGTLIL